MKPFLPSGGGDVAATKPLVLCADDYAQSAAISTAIRRLAMQGRLSATSAMVLSPRWPEEAAALRTEARGRIDVGLYTLEHQRSDDPASISRTARSW